MPINFKEKTPLYLQIVTHLKEQILSGELQLNEKIQSNKELAAFYRVSLITIKKAISELIREGVLFARVGKGTYVARKPIATKFNKHITLGLVLRDLESPYFSRIVYSVDKVSSQKGFHLLLSTSANRIEQEENQIYRYRQLGVHGLIIASMTRTYRASDALKQLHKENFPYVAVSYVADTDVNYVGTEHEYGAYLATEHLIKLGYDTIGYINGERGNLLGEVRKKGYLEALKDYNKPYHKNFEFHLSIRGQWRDYESGYSIGKNFAKLKRKADALFVYNDLAALGFQKAVLEEGLRIPQDVALVGFDNIQPAIAAAVPLTTIDQPTEKIGSLAVDMLYKMIHGEPLENRRVILNPTLIIRESCGAKVKSPALNLNL